MSLTLGKIVFKTYLLTLANQQNDQLTKEVAINELVDQLEIFIKSATVVVPAIGLVSPSGAVTGSAVGELS